MKESKKNTKCKECGNITWNYEYYCDECNDKIGNDIIRINVTSVSDKDKHALIEDEGEFCSLECILKDLKDWDTLINLNITGINPNNLKRVKK